MQWASTPVDFAGMPNGFLGYKTRGYWIAARAYGSPDPAASDSASSSLVRVKVEKV